MNESLITGLEGAATAIAVDAHQNIWAVAGSSVAGENGVQVLQNTGTVASPSYSGPNFVFFGIPDSFASGIAFKDNGAGSYTAYVSTAGPSSGFTPINPTLTGDTVTGGTVGSISTAGNAVVADRVDGSGTVFAADGSQLVKYIPATSTTVILNPCHYATTTGNATCNTAPYTGISSVALDSTGSMWATIPGSSAMLQVIGVAAPTWPLLPLGNFTQPQ